jgi:hypothetical protein
MRLHSHPQASLPTQELVDLVESLRPELDAIFTAQCLTSGQAEEILFGSMVNLGLRWHKIDERRAFLLACVERRCRAVAAGED